MCAQSAGGRKYPTVPVVGRVWLSVNAPWRLGFEKRGAVLGNLRASPVLRTALRVRLAVGARIAAMLARHSGCCLFGAVFGRSRQHQAGSSFRAVRASAA